MSRRRIRTKWPWERDPNDHAARVTRGLRMASTADRLALLDRVTAAVLAQSTLLDPPDPVPVPEEYRRPGRGERIHPHR